MQEEAPLTPLFYFNLVFCLLCLIYFSSGIVCLFYHRNKPYMRVRLPFFILFSNFGAIILAAILAAMLFLSLAEGSLSAHIEAQCIVSTIMVSLTDFFVFWPTFIRLFYVHRILYVVRSFYANSNEELARARKIRIEAFIFFAALVVEIIQLGFTFTVAFETNFREAFCACSLISQSESMAGHVIISIGYSLQIFATLFFLVAILARRIRLKYKIKEELLVVSICLIFTRLSSLISLTHYNCYYILSNFLYQPEYYISFTLLVTMFTFKVPVTLCMNRHAKEGPNINSLIREFPQALYFWTPNFYFDQFLREVHPSHVNYRPFIADILRYDFQMSEGIPRKFSNRPNSIQWSPIRESTRKWKKMLDLALYIGYRYLREDSPGYCGFQDHPDVLYSIREKYESLEENLDEFLFEFVRPYIEARLTPLYKEFIEAKEFQAMKKEIRAGEIFEWVLSSRQL